MVPVVLNSQMLLAWSMENAASIIQRISVLRLAWVKMVILNMPDQTMAGPIITLVVRSLTTAMLFHIIPIPLQSMTATLMLKCVHQ